MIAAVFIARDEKTPDDEFPRYECALNGDAFVHTAKTKGGDVGNGSFVYWGFAYEGDSGDTSSYSGSQEKQKGMHHCNPLRCVNFCNDESLIVCSVKSGLSFARLKDCVVRQHQDGELNDLAGTFCSQVVGMVLHEMRELCVGRYKNQNQDKQVIWNIDRLYMFIHWGGGNPSEYEKAFARYVREFVTTDLKTVNEEINRHYNDRCNFCVNDIFAFAVSSRKDGCFNVNGDVIKVPTNANEIEQLAARFSFDILKNYLTKYVVENETHKRVGGVKTAVDVEETGDAEVLRRYIHEMMRTETMKTRPQLVAQWMTRNYKAKALGRFMNIANESGIDLDDRIAALFATLIREGVSHG